MSFLEQPNPPEKSLSSIEDDALAGAVDKMWSTYDTDGNGYLDKEETKRFVMDTLKSMGTTDNVSQEDLDAAFIEFDTDKTGKITKENMIAYMRKAAGL